MSLHLKIIQPEVIDLDNIFMAPFTSQVDRIKTLTVISLVNFLHVVH